MKSRKRADSGQDLVEYALVLPLFFILILSVIELSIIYYQQTVVVNAAREGARSGIVRETAACPQSCLNGKVRAAAKAITAGLDPTYLTISYLWLYPANAPAQVRVTVRYEASLMTEFFIEAVGGDGDITLESIATMQREF